MTNTTRITADVALTLPRCDFIALYLVVSPRRAENRGPCGSQVHHAGGEYRVVSRIAGGTVVYQTRDAAKLFDYARRGELGVLTREADEFRCRAYTQAAA